MLRATGLPAAAAPITFNTALPVSESEVILREQIIIDPGDGGSASRRAVGLLTVLGYGVGPRLAAFASLPVTWRRVRQDSHRRQASGFGDLQLMARYTAYRRDRLGRTFRLAPFVGLKAPTGADSKSDALGPLPPSVQSGTGSWDGFGGLIATYATVPWQLDGQLAYRVNTRAGGFSVGNAFQADLSFQYRLLPHRTGNGSTGTLFAVLEANLAHQARNRRAGIAEPNSGGTSFYLSPGIQYAAKRWIAEAAVQIPIVQDLNGAALRRDPTIRAGIRVNF